MHLCYILSDSDLVNTVILKERMVSFLDVSVSLLFLIMMASADEVTEINENNILPLTVGLRGPPSLPSLSNTNISSKSDTCHAGALCVGPGELYPLGRVPGVTWSSRFVVPPLPSEFDTTDMTYYDYLNIFWRSNPPGGYMNQFVPQLMLGNALANSTNAPHFKPLWIKLPSWHVGAQYFMGLCPNTTTSDCKDNWIPRAVTGRLVPVKPGEVVETSFSLEKVEQHCCDEKIKFVWTLRIGVVGGGSNRQSVVVSDRPFMGLVNSTFSWGESTYEHIYVGSCLENYGMQSPANYPSKWQIDVKVVDAPGRDEDCWRNWRLESWRNHCSWQPRSTVANGMARKSQHVRWTAELENASGIDTAVSRRQLRH